MAGNISQVTQIKQITFMITDILLFLTITYREIQIDRSAKLVIGGCGLYSFAIG